MKRRSFLQLLGTAAGALIAPEILIPSRTFFLPPAGGWRSSDYEVWATDGTHEIPANIAPMAVRFAQYFTDSQKFAIPSGIARAFVDGQEVTVDGMIEHGLSLAFEQRNLRQVELWVPGTESITDYRGG